MNNHLFLREGTRTAHNDLEAFFPSLQPNHLPPHGDEYMRWLTILYNGYNKVVSHAKSLLVERSDIEEMSSEIIPLLEHDLSMIKADPKIEALFHEEYLPSTYYNLLGELYVLHGSSLGAKVIYKKLKHHSVDLPLSYLAYKQATSLGQWKSFVQEITALDQDQIAEVEEGAHEMFDVLIKWVREARAHDRRG